MHKHILNYIDFDVHSSNNHANVSVYLKLSQSKIVYSPHSINDKDALLYFNKIDKL